MKFSRIYTGCAVHLHPEELISDIHHGSVNPPHLAKYSTLHKHILFSQMEYENL